MKEVIGWILVAISALGALYTVGLIISYILLPKDLNDDYLDDINCDCNGCQAHNLDELPPKETNA